MSKITPFLWFDGDLREIVDFYISVFPESRVVDINPMSATFELYGQTLMALKGGPQFKFTEAVSFFVKCKDQTEVDYYWDKLTANGGVEGRCGWLKDKYGLSWQIIPNRLGELLSEKDRAKANRAMQAMLTMKKIDVAALDRAAAS